MDYADDKIDTWGWVEDVADYVGAKFLEAVTVQIERENYMRSTWKFIVYIFNLPIVIWTKRINLNRRMLFSKSGWLAKVGKRKRSGT